MSRYSLGDELYAGTSSFGKTWAIISALFSTFVGAFLIVGGVNSYHRAKQIKSVVGMVLDDSICPENTSACRTVVGYTVDGKIYTQRFNTSAFYKKGDQITLYYTKPAEPFLSKMPTAIGTWLIIIGAGIVLFGWLFAILAMRFKAYAAMEGISAGFRLR